MKMYINKNKDDDKKVYNQYWKAQSLDIDVSNIQREAGFLYGITIPGGCIALGVAALGNYVWNNPDIVQVGLTFSGMFFGIAGLVGAYHIAKALKHDSEKEKFNRLIFENELDECYKRDKLKNKKSLTMQQNQQNSQQEK